MSAKVNITKRVRTDGGLRFCPVVISANGRIKPNWVVVAGKEEHHPEGSYFIDWTAGGKRERKSVGDEATQAMNRKLRKETELRAIEHGIALVEDPADSPAGRTGLGEAAEQYIEEIKLTKKPRTLAAYSTSLLYFQEACGLQKVRYLDQIERGTILRFVAFLREEKDLAPRSVYNKFENVVTFLKVAGLPKLMRKTDWPQYTEEDVEVYERDELDALLAASDAHHRLLWQFYLMTGMRKQEVAHADWRDINFRQGLARVRWKPEWNWTPKAYKEREIPIPEKLLAQLDGVRRREGLIFPDGGGKPHRHHLEVLLAHATKTPFPAHHFWLHKFRATFCSWHLQAGVDLRTAQSWMGHSDLASTMRYLKPARHDAVRDKVNATFC